MGAGASGLIGTPSGRYCLMHQYEVIIYYSQEDEAYIAEVPELPGCMADGAAKYEALRQAEIAVEEWLETAKLMGREIPQPRGKLQ